MLINYDVFVNDRRCKGTIEKGLSEYRFEAEEGSLIRINKENKWGLESKLNSAFMFLYILYLVMGNVMKSNKLPIGVDFEIKLSDNKQIHLSNILAAATKGIKRWNKGAFI